jgi:NADH-quinone oxidoreductase subunit L
MYVPLIILAVMAVAVVWQPSQGLWGSALAGIALFVWSRVRNRGGSEANGATQRFRLGSLPLVICGLVFALSLLWAISPLQRVVLASLLGQSEPASVASGMTGVLMGWEWPSEHDSHVSTIVVPVTLIAIGTSVAGFLLATFMYGLGRVDPADVRGQFEPIYRFLRNKWWFDELYDLLFVKPILVLSRFAAGIDRKWIDWIVDGIAKVTRRFSVAWDRLADQSIVDGFVNLLARWTYIVGRSLRAVQTGRLRQYVMFIAIGAVAIFVLIRLWNSTPAG